MLVLPVSEAEMYDERTEEFITVKPVVLRLEHSLVSIAKWETKWRKPFLDRKTQRTTEETLDYIRCMTLNQNIDPNVYRALKPRDLEKINEYIGAELTATWFNDRHGGRQSHEIMTSELIYYYMIAYGIPFECQKWHFSRLMTLIRICGIKSSDKKMSKRAVMAQNKSLNAARRAAMHSRG